MEKPSLRALVCNLFLFKFHSYGRRCAGVNVAFDCSTGGWYFINFYANGKISASVVSGPGWRWGYGIYALCYLPALLPIVCTIYHLPKLGIFPHLAPDLASILGSAQSEEARRAGWRGNFDETRLEHSYQGLYR